MERISHKDALGNEIIIGNRYGYSVDNNGFTTVSIGIASNFNDRGISLKLESVVKGLWSDEPVKKNIKGNSVTVKCMKLFPVTDPIKSDRTDDEWGAILFK